MASVDVRVPDIGDFDEVEVIEVLVAKGDRVDVEDAIVTLESDKATMELPAPAAGVVEAVAVSVGDAVSEGTLLLTLRVEAASDAGEREAQAPPVPEVPPPGVAAQPEAPRTAPVPARTAPVPPPPPVAPGGAAGAVPPHASPLVRRMARELGVDLRTAAGSGPAGRILEEDVKATVRAAFEQGGGAAPRASEPAPVIDFARYGEIEEVALSKIRRVAGRNLSRAWQEIPHVTQHDEADVEEVEALRKRFAAQLAEEGVRLSPLLFVMKACAIALREFPNVRSSLAPGGEHLIVKHFFHLGIAVDTENGLVVPVVRDVDRKGLRELAVEVADVAERARARKLRPADFEGAVFSISSLGGIGGTAFTPIVNPPQVAILGLSRTRPMPVWDAERGSFLPRKHLPLSLSYDHRVIDGAEAVRFTTRLAAVLADPAQLLL